MGRNIREFTSAVDCSTSDAQQTNLRMGRGMEAFLIYISLFLDNVLLTVIVPILPDYLVQLHEADAVLNVPKSVAFKSFDLHYVPRILGKHPLSGGSMINFTTSTGRSGFGEEYFTLRVNDSAVVKTTADEIVGSQMVNGDEHWLSGENGSIGMLLATKALIQLLVTPFVGRLTLQLGYRIPIVFGTFCLLIASLVFASGSSYTSLLLARSMQGIASACIGVCGMSLIAELYPEDGKRSKVMGVILGSVALGVLIGYPFGGILYDFVGKSAPFYILSAIISCNFVLQLLTMDLRNINVEVTSSSDTSSSPCTLLTDLTIVKIIVAIWISTSAMAILEPCLPIWLMENMQPKKWQIGTVFIPDSVGYFVGTNFFASFAYRVGQINISVVSLLVIGFSCFIIPNTTTVLSLMVPHFTLGLGIGVLDAALVPMLASLVDARYAHSDDDSEDAISNYGAVYAIQQMSVSLAYSLGPMLGGEVAQQMGFRWLMFIVGTINILYGLCLLALWLRSSNKTLSDGTTILLTDKSCGAQQQHDYKRFYNTIDVP